MSKKLIEKVSFTLSLIVGTIGISLSLFCNKDCRNTHFSFVDDMNVVTLAAIVFIPITILCFYRFKAFIVSDENNIESFIDLIIPVTLITGMIYLIITEPELHAF